LYAKGFGLSKRLGRGRFQNGSGSIHSNTKQLRTLLDVAVQYLDEVFGGAGLAGIDLGILAQDVKTNLAVDNFDEQGIDGTAAGRDLLEHAGAFLFVLDGNANAFELALDAIDACQQFLFFHSSVSHPRESP
jgi:hypothetical protein